MERELFDQAGGWDQHDTIGFQFYDCTLKKDVGKFKSGEKFQYISVDYGVDIATYHLHLTVGGEYKGE